MLALVQQPKYTPDVLDRQICFLRDHGVGVSSFLQPFDVMQKVDRTMLSTGQILDQTHDEAVFRVRFDNKRRDLVLAKRLICFEPTLPAYKIETCLICTASSRHCDRLLEAKLGDVRD